MPLLYGERLTAAFRRLQLEILQMHDDTSIFAWRSPVPTYSLSEIDTYGLLAPEPASFNKSADIIRADLPVVRGYKKGIRTPILFNNKGLHLSLPEIPLSDRHLSVILGYTTASRRDEWLTLRLRGISKNDGRYVRIKDVRHIQRSEVKSKAYFRDLTTETRLFRKVPVVSSLQWHRTRSKEPPMYLTTSRIDAPVSLTIIRSQEGETIIIEKPKNPRDRQHAVPINIQGSEELNAGITTNWRMFQ